MQKPGKKIEKFPHKGRAGYLARKKLAEEQKEKNPSPTTVGTPFSKGRIKTGWGKVAQWYHETVEDKASYQRDLIMPNLMRLMDIRPGQKILDLGCGEGLFTRRFAKAGAEVTAIDISKELVEIAKREATNENEHYKFQPRFFVSDAARIPMVADASQDIVLINLALQNIEDAPSVLKECSRVLKPAGLRQGSGEPKGGKLFIVLNHPAFRGIKVSDWSWGSANDQRPATSDQIQYRRVWQYLSESRERVQMKPGDNPSEQTISFNRPLQFYCKAIGKAGLAVTNMEEWVSNKKSQPGPRAAAENKARTEIPLFMVLVCLKI